MRLGVPHGLACGFVLPEVLSFNKEADPALFERVARELGYAPSTELEVGVGQMVDHLDVGWLLDQYGLSVERALECVPEMLTPGRADNNLRDASLDDVSALVARAIRERLR